MSTYPDDEKIKQQFKDIMADVFKGRLSPLYADEWLAKILAALRADHARELEEVSIKSRELEAKHWFDCFYSFCIVPAKPNVFEFGREMTMRLQELAVAREAHTTPPTEELVDKR